MKNPNWTSNKGTLAYTLNSHQQQIFDLINKNKFQELKNLVNKILADKTLTKNPRTLQAQQELKNASHNANYYYSVLMTFMTGVKVSI